MTRTLKPWMLGFALLVLPGCFDDTVSPRDVTPPAAPRGVYSVTGSGQVTIHWLANTEGDVAGYRVYEGDCASGASCPYDRVGATTGTSFTVTGLANGVTKYFAVAAYDRAGNESDLSYEDLFDTPRPEGFGEVLAAAQDKPLLAGWDFSAALVRAWDDARTDMYFSATSLNEMLVPDPSTTGIQDMGYASTLDAVDFAPATGWSPTGGVELIVGHNYVVKTADGHYAKLRVTGLGASVTFDWAYQTAAGNRELRIRPAAGAIVRPGAAPAAQGLTPISAVKGNN
jgi:hypothetical protein